jgi:hypothetical protein
MDLTYAHGERELVLEAISQLTEGVGCRVPQGLDPFAGGPSFCALCKGWALPTAYVAATRQDESAALPLTID